MSEDWVQLFKMAQEEGESWWNSWTSGILENVREKTSSALEFVQNDLSEFVTTIQHDASVVIADSATAVNSSLKVDESEKDAPSGKLKKGLSSLLTTISLTLHEAAESSTEAASSLQGAELRTDQQKSITTVMPVFDRTQVRLQEIQTNPDTYHNDPDGEAYQTWCSSFDLDVKKGEISELLVNNTDIRRLYTKFVPSDQSHSTFWHRYFYKVHELEMGNKRLADIVARASQSESQEQDLGWDDEDEEELIVSPVALKEIQVSSTVHSKQTIDDTNITTLKEDVPQHETLQEKLECATNGQETETDTSTGEEGTAIQEEGTAIQEEGTAIQEEGSRCNIENVDELKRSIEKNAIDDNSEHSHSSHNKAGESENLQQNSILVESSVEAKSDEYKSDSSDSNSWIRVSDKEGSSTNSSSSVVVVQEKEKGLNWEDDVDEDKDDDFVLNDDISNEDVAKLVQSLTANEPDSDEDDWDEWE